MVARSLYRTPEQLDIITNAFATVFPDLISRIRLPWLSVDKRPIHAVRMRSGRQYGRRSVLVVGGLHGRELMPPDAIVDLMVDLCFSYQNGTPIAYGNRSWAAAEIKALVETLDIWMIPCANPDGRQAVFEVDDMWRKNIRQHADKACARDIDNDLSDGVDPNRNFDHAFMVQTGFTSCRNPCASSYCGEAAFSEPESANIRDFVDSHDLYVYVDVHSFSNKVMYPWAHAPTQFTDRSKVFTSLEKNVCQDLEPADHQEYMSLGDLRRYRTVAQWVVDSVKAVRGTTWGAISTYALYPGARGASGTSADYVYGRHIADPTARKTYAFALETGPDTGNNRESFHPSDEPTLKAIKREIKAAILTLIENSTCALEFIGMKELNDGPTIVEEIRALKDSTLMTTEPGLEWVDLFGRTQGAVLTQLLEDEGLQEQASRHLRRAATLMQNGKSRITARDVEGVGEFLQTIAERLPDEHRRSMELVRARLAQSAGMTASDVLTSLMSEGPQPDGPRQESPPAR